MTIATFIIPCFIASAAVVAHRHVAHYGQACLVAATSSALPSLVVFDVAGAARTGFAPFTIFALFLASLVGSAIIGLPFLIRRWRRKQPMAWIGLPGRISWPMVGGMLLVGAGAIAVVFGTDERLVIFLMVLCIAGPIVAALVGALFLAASALAGHAAPLPARQAFIAGAAMAAGLIVLVALSILHVPGQLNRPPHQLTMALALNAAFFVPALCGLAWGRRESRAHMRAMSALH